MSPLLYLTIILVLGVTAQWLAWKFKLPSILLLLGFGFAFGQFSGVRIDDFLAEGHGHESPLLSAVGLLVAIILFEGGLTLKFKELKESGLPILRLCTLAVAVSFALTTAFMTWALGYDVRIAALVGAILTVTGPTVIAPLLRHVNPTRKMAAILKWEGIVVDPIGAILGVLIFKVVAAEGLAAGGMQTLRSILLMIAVGIVGALLLAKGVEWLLKNHLVPDYLQPVFLLSVVGLAFTASNYVEKEAGLLSVTVLGIALANQRSVSVRHILEFKENLRILIISFLFLILSGRIEAADLMDALPEGLMLLAFLILIGRPVSVFASLANSKSINRKERTFLAFLAPRGIVAAAVTSIFALEFEQIAVSGHFGKLSPLIALQARQLVPIIFIVIVGTVSFYGLAAVPLARRLGVAARSTDGVLFAGANEWTRMLAKSLKEDGHRIMLIDTNYANISAAKMLNLEAHRANILSEFAEEELDLNGLGTLIACTPNDEVNSMASSRFIHQFGRAGVWQLRSKTGDSHHRRTAAGELRSRHCFSGEPDHETLRRMVEEGAVVKRAALTDVFGYDAFRKAYPAAVILFYHDGKTLRPCPPDVPKLSPGTTIHALVMKDSAPEGNDAEGSM